MILKSTTPAMLWSARLAMSSQSLDSIMHPSQSRKGEAVFNCFGKAAEIFALVAPLTSGGPVFPQVWDSPGGASRHWRGVAAPEHLHNLCAARLGAVAAVPGACGHSHDVNAALLPVHFFCCQRVREKESGWPPLTPPRCECPRAGVPRGADVYVRDPPHHHAHEPPDRRAGRRAAHHRHGQRLLFCCECLATRVLCLDGPLHAAPPPAAFFTVAYPSPPVCAPRLQVGNNQVDIDGVPCEVQSATSTRITCLTPKWTQSSEPLVSTVETLPDLRAFGSERHPRLVPP